MVSTEFTLLCVAPALLLFAGGSTSFVSGTAVVENNNPAGSLEELNDFAEYLVNNNDFGDEDALLETESLRDLVPFIRSAFSTSGPSAGGLILPKEEAIEFLEALQDVERLQNSQADYDKNAAANTDSDKNIAQRETLSGAKNTRLISYLLTRLVSVATLRNKISRKVSYIIDLLTTGENDAGLGNFTARVAAFMKELRDLQKRLVELADKFIELVLDAISIVKEEWQNATGEGQKFGILKFFQSLLRWADAAKQASETKWRLVQTLFTFQGKNGARQQALTEVATSDHLRVEKAAQDAGVDGNISFSPVHVVSLGSLFREVEEARRVERDMAQTVWHQAAKCASEGLLPLSFVRVLMSDA